MKIVSIPVTIYGTIEVVEAPEELIRGRTQGAIDKLLEGPPLPLGWAADGSGEYLKVDKVTATLSLPEKDPVASLFRKDD